MVIIMKKDYVQTWIIGIIAVVVALGFFSYTRVNNYGMMGMMGGYYGGGMMFFGWITWALIIALIAAAIYWLLKTADKK